MRSSRSGTLSFLITCALVIALAAQPARAQQSKPTWGQILISGGRDDNTAADLYDPASNRFAPEIATPRMKRRIGATATVLVSGPNAGKVLIAGGDNRNGIARASTELYDPATNTVVPGPHMHIPRTGHVAAAIAYGAGVGKILIAGGRDAGNYRLSSTELYDPQTNTFSPGPAPKNIRNGHTATVITSGPFAEKILIAGGANWLGDSPSLASTELYDPDSNAFSPGPSMNFPRARHTATTILSGRNAGKILIAGGMQKDGIVYSSIELYGPATNRFAPSGDTPEMNWVRFDAVAVQLPPKP